MNGILKPVQKPRLLVIWKYVIESGCDYDSNIITDAEKSSNPEIVKYVENKCNYNKKDKFENIY